MSKITDLPSAWRGDIVPASFRGARFHVEAYAKENARRIVLHEFPKKELPYAEDVGKRAVEFTVRGYCISYPYDTDVPLYRRDYRTARDLLLEQLEREGPGVLQLPLLPPLVVVCPRYRLTEETQRGGFCVFDLSFVEFGLPAAQLKIDTKAGVVKESNSLRNQTVAMVNRVMI